MYCNTCQRSFSTLDGYHQHMEYSAAHARADWECEVCDRNFISDNARTNHYIDGPHPYCKPCRRVFQNMNNYSVHMRSQKHMGSPIVCPFCKRGFTAASGVVVHLESGSCSSGLNRQMINDAIRRIDKNHVITRPLITMPGYNNNQTTATARAWNGRCYACYLCSKGFSSLNGLNSHLRSPFHEQAMYRCPKKSCSTTFKLLSSLVMHVESESCGVMRFGQVQQQAKRGIENMVGRMITG